MKKKLLKTLAITLALTCLPWGVACNNSADGDKNTNTQTNIPTYTVSTTASQGGTLTASASKVNEGEAVTFTAVGNAGYVLSSLKINGGEVAVSESVSEEGIHTYTWIAAAVLSNYAASAEFVLSDGEVIFDVGEGATPIANKQVAYGETYGELQTPTCTGKRFLGWLDKNGNPVSSTTVVKQSGEITLTANWWEVSEEEKLGLKPFTVTSTYYDAQATKYGVVWHTAVEPISPVIEVVKTSVTDGDGTYDFTQAQQASAEFEAWENEYVSQAVVENLEFNTEYAVRFGDEVAGVWSETYTFTTREEQIEDLSFFYLADTQEEYSLENQPTGTKIGKTYYSQVMREATKRFDNADFVAHGGDLVNYGSEPKYWREMLDSVEQYLFNLPIVFATGNHEGQWYAAGREVTNKIFNVNCDVEYAGDRGYYYSFDYGPMHFIVLRSNDALCEIDENWNYTGTYSEAQMKWLKADLAKANANPAIKWNVAMIHEGPISANEGFKSGSNYHQDKTGPVLLPILKQYNVDLLLFGHEHNLTSTYPVVWDETATPDLAGNTLSVVTNTVTKTVYDGVTVDEFVFTDNVVNRGTVIHQTGTAGMQYQYKYKLADLQTNLTSYSWRSIWRMLLSGGHKYINEADNVGRSMYSYVEVSDNTLVLRTYGVNGKGLAAETDESKVLDYGVYLDGFMLRK